MPTFAAFRIAPSFSNPQIMNASQSNKDIPAAHPGTDMTAADPFIVASLEIVRSAQADILTRHTLANR